ncbi:MAG: hypothetical protein F4X64_09510 [Chloroflexi bacterium]|nr:hypothetical protein [Chloroflexota bacterium]
MTQPPEPGPDKAHWHYQRADAYRELAEGMLERSRTATEHAAVLADAAGALLYEAAKQCVNAVANLRGNDPQDNHAKIAVVRAIIAEGFTSYDLRGGARAAWELHIHADQGGLLPDRFADRFAMAADFVYEMQAIYRNIAAPG